MCEIPLGFAKCPQGNKIVPNWELLLDSFVVSHSALTFGKNFCNVHRIIAKGKLIMPKKCQIIYYRTREWGFGREIDYISKTVIYIYLLSEFLDKA